MVDSVDIYPWELIAHSQEFERIEVLVDLQDRDRDPIDHERPRVEPGEGNLYSSELRHNPGMHAPTLDIDIPCRLVESTTPGHYHLYIDKALSWQTYCNLLMALREAGIIQQGYCDLSLARGASHLRKPDVEKHDLDAPDS